MKNRVTNLSEQRRTARKRLTSILNESQSRAKNISSSRIRTNESAEGSDTAKNINFFTLMSSVNESLLKPAGKKKYINDRTRKVTESDNPRENVVGSEEDIPARSVEQEPQYGEDSIAVLDMAAQQKPADLLAADVLLAIFDVADSDDIAADICEIAEENNIDVYLDSEEIVTEDPAEICDLLAETVNDDSTYVKWCKFIDNVLQISLGGISFIFVFNDEGSSALIDTLGELGIDHELSDELSGEEPVDESARVEKMQESVANRFARYRRMYESDDDKDGGSDSAGEEDDFFSDADSDDASADDSDKDEDKDASDDKSDSKDKEDDEDIPMTAIVLTVNKDDAEKCKDEMIDAGIDEDDIEILDSDDDDETTEIKVDANSVMALKDYLDGKGIDLEEKIGGEIVDDNDEDKEDNEDGEAAGDEGDKDSDKDKDDSFADFTEDDLDDLFADDADDNK